MQIIRLVMHKLASQLLDTFFSWLEVELVGFERGKNVKLFQAQK